ncbi:MAG: type II secretion system major pseudopilin GspG [Legionellaceae bacterium]|nr:type II secretion system major pseudopilin GspG [Legionellaceae bacterium]
MQQSRGFSLIEIMVVIVILGILASLVVPKIMSRPEEARLVKAKQDIQSIQNALDLYRLDNGSYPSSEQGLNALVHQPDSDPVPQNWQPYLKSIPKDPWGHNYTYANPGEHGEVDVYTEAPRHNQSSLIIGNWES